MASARLADMCPMMRILGTTLFTRQGDMLIYHHDEKKLWRESKQVKDLLTKCNIEAYTISRSTISQC